MNQSGLNSYFCRALCARVYLTLIATCLSLATLAQADEPARRRNFNTGNGIALREFDAVSYFTGSRPLKGNSKFYHHHRGITYYFANAENLETFKKSPEKYEPAYGGWCAYTVALNGERVKVNPVTYKLVEGKLHLFYNYNSDNRLTEWIEEKNIAPNVVNAMEAEDDVKKERIKNLFPAKWQNLFGEFAGVVGSRIHLNLKSGARLYYRFVLRKPV